jgi:hypothetical protein
VTQVLWRRKKKNFKQKHPSPYLANPKTRPPSTTVYASSQFDRHLSDFRAHAVTVRSGVYFSDRE